MRNLSLFPLEDDELSPQADRIEPTFWLRRLVLLPKFDGDTEPTRDIEFRRGLNIVQTSPRQDSDTEVVGHSVGKTLLTRLIRYTLGEPNYATQAEKTKILGHRPDGCVIAHWRVDHVDWCVVRPFQPDRRNAPFAIRSENWRRVFDPTCDRVSIDEFTQCLREATCGSLLELPNRALDHSMWLKVVAFLTRDWQCGYRRFNDWRDSDSESDVTVDRNEASRLCRWLMNLIEIEELPLWSNHNSLRNDLARTTAERQRHNLVLQTVDPELQRRLECSDSDESPVGLFAGRLTDAVSRKLEQLMALLNDCVERSELQVLETQHNQIDDQLERQIADHSKAESKLNHLTHELQTRLKANDAEAYSRTSSYENCRLAECPMKLVNRPTPLSEPGFEEITETLREEIEDCRRDVMRMTHSCDQLRAQRKEIRSRLRAERQRVNQETSAIERTIGRWHAYREDVERRQAASQKVMQCDAELKRLKSEIKASLKTQALIRDEQQRQLNAMSQRFSTVLNDVFGVKGGGKFRLNGFGLEPEVDPKLAPGGAALGAMAKVLAFDLTCMAASIEGLGNHPRFLIHDSPRSSDTEEPLFHKLFRVVSGWESSFPKDSASFQYIITTTTPPPADLVTAENAPVRLTLSARRDDERLLKFRY